jgi:hypothetical protein
LALVGCGLPGVGGAASGGASQDLTALEQLSLERINRARLKPAAEAVLFGINLNEGVPAGQQIDIAAKQALALNASLTQAARAHSQDMLTRNYFAHNTPEGTTPFQRITNAGYLYASAGENLAWQGTTGTLNEAPTVEDEHRILFVDSSVADRGHRTTMLDADFREVGVGIVRGTFRDGLVQYDSLMQTQDYASPASGSVFVLGVVYDDSNANGAYDYGEGVADYTVTLAGVAKTTNAGGGYAFEVRQAGAYTLAFASGVSQDLNIPAGAFNIKIDLLDRTRMVLNLGVGSLN